MTRATNAAVIQSKALLAQSEVMQNQLDESKAARRMDERARVGPTDTQGIIHDGTNIYFKIFVKNSAKLRQ
ncbi:MAG: hypothetical protein WBN22_06720 [Verrucomicrobiia bacterium]